MTSTPQTNPAMAPQPVPPDSPPWAPLLAALQLLSIVPIHRAFHERVLGRAVGWFPAVGCLLGVALACFDAAFRAVLPTPVAATLVLVAWVVLTGALHLDGFLDACDGLLGGRTPEERLRIFRDERVGAFAVIGGALLLLLKYSCLVSVEHRATMLILACTLARWVMAEAVIRYPYARPEGLGRVLTEHVGHREEATASVIALCVAVFVAVAIGPPRLLLAMPAALVSMFWLGHVGCRRVGGLTGDLYGAICELAEAVVLIVCAASKVHLAR